VLVALADFPAHIIKHNANPKPIWTSALIMLSTCAVGTSSV
jgi:hypothetical protein